MAPIFDYKAYDTTGKTVKGIVEAESQKIAHARLKKKGLMVTAIVEKGSPKQSQSSSLPFLTGRVSVQDISLLTRQLASLVKANIPLVEALSALVEQTEKPRLKVVLDDVRNQVNQGIGLAKAMAAHPKVFDNIFANMVEAGESSGTLGLVLLRLADLKEAQLRLRNSVKSAMTYPALMVVVSVLLLVGIFAFVVPELTKIFKSMGKELPLSTEILIWISNTLINYWMLIIAGCFVLTVMFFRYINSPKGRPKWDAYKLSAPIFGELFRLVAIARFARTMGTLLGSGVPILVSMNISKNLVGNTVVEKALNDARENITEGQSIAGPLKKSGEFPPMVIHMIAIGEKTGELPDMFRNIADTYEEQVNSKVETMTSLLQPIMIVVMGGVVAFIVLSIFVPLLEISNIKQ